MKNIKFKFIQLHTAISSKVYASILIAIFIFLPPNFSNAQTYDREAGFTYGTYGQYQYPTSEAEEMPASKLPKDYLVKVHDVSSGFKDDLYLVSEKTLTIWRGKYRNPVIYEKVFEHTFNPTEKQNWEKLLANIPLASMKEHYDYKEIYPHQLVFDGSQHVFYFNLPQGEKRISLDNWHQDNLSEIAKMINSISPDYKIPDGLHEVALLFQRMGLPSWWDSPLALNLLYLLVIISLILALLYYLSKKAFRLVKNRLSS